MNRIEEVREKAKNQHKILVASPDLAMESAISDIDYLLSEIDRLTAETKKQHEIWCECDSRMEKMVNEKLDLLEKVEQLTAELEQWKMRSGALEKVVKNNLACGTCENLKIGNQYIKEPCISCESQINWKFDQARFTDKQPKSYHEK